jgi:hypothetical protein
MLFKKKSTGSIKTSFSSIFSVWVINPNNRLRLFNFSLTWKLKGRKENYDFFTFKLLQRLKNISTKLILNVHVLINFSCERLWTCSGNKHFHIYVVAIFHWKRIYNFPIIKIY